MSDADRNDAPDLAGSSVSIGRDSFEEMDLELAFLRCLPLAPPFGRHKHFRIIALQSMIHEITGFLIPFAEIWSRLSGMYDLSEMDEIASVSADLPSSPKILSPLPGPFRPDIDSTSSSSAAGDDKEDQSPLSSPRSPPRNHSMSPSLSPPPPTPRKVKEEEQSLEDEQDTSSRRSKRKASISGGRVEEPRKRGRPRAGSGVRRGQSAGSRFISRSPSRNSVSPGPTGRPSMTKLHPNSKSKNQREAFALSPLKSPSRTPFSPVPISGTTWLYPTVFPYPVLPPSMTETSHQLKDGRPAGRSRKQEFKKGERTSPRPPPMDDLQYSSKVYETNGLNPHVHRSLPMSGKDDESTTQSTHRGSGSKSADCLNSRHFEREFSLPFFESYIAHADATDDQDSGLDAMVASISGEETQKWHDLAYQRASRGVKPDQSSAVRAVGDHLRLQQLADQIESEETWGPTRAVSFTTTHREALEVDAGLDLSDEETSSEMTIEENVKPMRRRR